MESFKLDETVTLAKSMLARAKKLPVVYDEDSPEMTEDMERAFAAARRRKPYRQLPSAN